MVAADLSSTESLRQDLFAHLRQRVIRNDHTHALAMLGELGLQT